MTLTFRSPHDQPRGLIASMLERCYADLLTTDPDHWAPEVPGWEEYDRAVFDHPETIGDCIFLSMAGDRIVGFGSWDPREAPELGRIGHNCVLPQFRGRGYGAEQIEEILRRLRARGIRKVWTSTLDGAWHEPARRMYLRCGFREAGRRPWSRNPSLAVIEYEKEIDPR